MTGLVKWNHPQLGQITFQDCRPGAKTAEPDNNTLAALGVIHKALAETPGHEGRHAAVTMLFGLKPIEAKAAFPGEDGTLGYVQFDYTGETWTRMRLAEYMVGLIAGPLGEKAGAPQWPLRGGEGGSDEEALARVADQLQLNQKQYEGLVDVAEAVRSSVCEAGATVVMSVGESVSEVNLEAS
jgi:hypothetical protein